MRITRVVTKTGDRGETALAGGRRVAKNDPRVCAYGEVDELNSLIGVVRAFGPPPRLAEMLERMQHQLFVVGADLATPAEIVGTRVEEAVEVAELEAWIEELMEVMDPLREFVLPGGGAVGAHLQLARAVARRAERVAVGLEGVSEAVIVYLNRLSDLLFVMARAANHMEGAPETLAQFKKK
jgi:cob(I)alamin adenosyltransferase